MRATTNAFAIALTTLVLATASRAELLETLEGDVRELAPPASLVAPGAPAASFVLISAGSNRDLRDAPGALLIFTDGGLLVAIADDDARRFAPWRRDPESQRPLRADAPAGSRCATGAEAACWRPGDGVPYSRQVADALGAALLPRIPSEPARASPSLNQSLYTMICATSIGFSAIDRATCGQSVFTTPPTMPGTRHSELSMSSLLSNILAGNRTAATLATNFLAGTPVPLVPLNVDPCDRFLSNDQAGCTNIVARTSAAFFGAGSNATLNEVLTDEQEALLGCGPFYGTDCEADGIDLLNVERSVLLQSFGGLGGDYDLSYFSPGFGGWQYGTGLPQPGASPPFIGPKPVNGQCAGATQLGVPCTDLSGQPLQGGGYGNSTGQTFQSEMAALSFNMQSLLVAFSAPAPTTDPSVLDASNPFSRAPGQCSFAQPQYCSSVWTFFSYATHTPDGESRWLWESGAEYRIVDAFGDVGDYNGGVVHVLGVEESRTREASLGVPIALFPAEGRALAADTRFAVAEAGYGFAYLTAPEPSGAALAIAAFAALAAIDRRRRAR